MKNLKYVVFSFLISVSQLAAAQFSTSVPQYLKESLETYPYGYFEGLSKFRVSLDVMTSDGKKVSVREGGFGFINEPPYQRFIMEVGIDDYEIVTYFDDINKQIVPGSISSVRINRPEDIWNYRDFSAIHGRAKNIIWTFYDRKKNKLAEGFELSDFSAWGAPDQIRMLNKERQIFYIKASDVEFAYTQAKVASYDQVSRLIPDQDDPKKYAQMFGVQYLKTHAVPGTTRTREFLRAFIRENAFLCTFCRDETLSGEGLKDSYIGVMPHSLAAQISWKTDPQSESYTSFLLDLSVLEKYPQDFNFKSYFATHYFGVPDFKFHRIQEALPLSVVKKILVNSQAAKEALIHLLKTEVYPLPQGESLDSFVVVFEDLNELTN